MVPTQFQTSDEDPWLNAVLVEAGDDGRAISIEQILRPGLGQAPGSAGRAAP